MEEDYNQIFKKACGFELAKSKTLIGSCNPVDSHIFEKVSRLFFENKEEYDFLKKKTKESLHLGKPIIYSVMGYFHYVDCEFDDAIKCFKKALELDNDDLEIILCLAFCYRQKGDEKKFNNILKKFVINPCH